MQCFDCLSRIKRHRSSIDAPVRQILATIISDAIGGGSNNGFPGKMPGSQPVAQLQIDEMSTIACDEKKEPSSLRWDGSFTCSGVANSPARKAAIEIVPPSAGTSIAS